MIFASSTNICEPLTSSIEQQQTEIEITIAVPIDAEVGTHYGGILFGQKVGVVGGNGPQVQHKAGSIILVKLGQSQEKVALNNFFTQKCQN